jgi:hypothetical protein
LELGSASAITIKADDVQLSLGGHTLEAPGKDNFGRSYSDKV